MSLCFSENVSFVEASNENVMIFWLNDFRDKTRSPHLLILKTQFLIKFITRGAFNNLCHFNYGVLLH